MDRVRFLTDVPDVDVPALYNCAEIYLGLSRPEGLLIEGFGISLSEASACGVPVIGGNVGGIPDAVRNGETGLLVDPTDLQAVVASVESLLRDRQLGQRLGQAGRRAVEGYFNWDRVTADVQRLGEEFAQTPSRSRAGNLWLTVHSAAENPPPPAGASSAKRTTT
jgi:phosphatidylinositol alpha-1,6-mannosyltransferase